MKSKYITEHDYNSYSKASNPFGTLLFIIEIPSPQYSADIIRADIHADIDLSLK